MTPSQPPAGSPEQPVWQAPPTASGAAPQPAAPEPQASQAQVPEPQGQTPQTQTPPAWQPATPPPAGYSQPVAPVQPTRPASKKGSGAAGTILLAVASLVAVGGIAFAVGRVTAPAGTSASSGFTAGAAGGFGTGTTGGTGTGGTGATGTTGGTGTAGRGIGAFGRGGGAAIQATVTAVNPDSLTVQIGGTSGRTLDVKLDSSTKYFTQQPGAVADVTAGSKVLLQLNPSATASGAPAGGFGSGGNSGTGNAAPGASGAPGAGFPGAGGFLNDLGTVKDVTVLAP
jgi:hypothetical protein